MNKIFHPSNKTDDASEDVVALAINKCRKEKDEMKKQYEDRILALENQSNGTVVVMQAMVLVARKSPNDFFALLEYWNLVDLKYIAAAMQNRLQCLKEMQARQKSEEQKNDDVIAQMEQSTAQRLYVYVMRDPQADKDTVIQVINELHNELALLEEMAEDESRLPSQQKVMPKEIQFSCDDNVST